MTGARSPGTDAAREPRRQLQVVATVWLILAVAYGLAFAFPIFFVALLDEFRWSRALTAGAMSMSAFLQGLLAPVTGIVVDRVGPRRVILSGIALLSASSILAATIRTPGELYLYTGLVGAMGIVALGWAPWVSCCPTGSRNGAAAWSVSPFPAWALASSSSVRSVSGSSIASAGAPPAWRSAWPCWWCYCRAPGGAAAPRRPEGTSPLTSSAGGPRGAFLVVGLGFGARGPIITAIATELFGGRRFGVIYGVLNMGNGVGAAIGPWFGGAVHDALGSYRMVFLSSILFSALASACFWLARRRTP